MATAGNMSEKVLNLLYTMATEDLPVEPDWKGAFAQVYAEVQSLRGAQEVRAFLLELMEWSHGPADIALDDTGQWKLWLSGTSKLIYADTFHKLVQATNDWKAHRLANLANIQAANKEG